MSFTLSPGPGAEAIAQNLADIHARMAAACRNSSRDPDSVRLLAVSKTYAIQAIRDAAQAGQRLFGENRVQEGTAKIPAAPGTLEWHLIGHLQTNKAAAAVQLFDWIHSVDSLKLIEHLDRHAEAAGRRPAILLQVNVSGEKVKSGCTPEELPALIEAANACSNLTLHGLMTIPPLHPDPETARPHFRRLRHLAETHNLPELSMGMSHDLETAIEEGATLIRIGTALFGPRP